MGNLLQPEEEVRKVILRDGAEYDLVPLDMNLMIEIEDHFEKPMAVIFREGWMRNLRYAFWILLKQTHTEMTEEQAGHLITARVISLMTDTFQDMLGIEKEEPEKEG